jgi:hypothetical protein
MDFANHIPMAEVLRAANDLVAKGIIRDYAIGGAISPLSSRICGTADGSSKALICFAQVFQSNSWLPAG